MLVNERHKPGLSSAHWDICHPTHHPYASLLFSWLLACKPPGREALLQGGNSALDALTEPIFA